MDDELGQQLERTLREQLSALGQLAYILRQRRATLDRRTRDQDAAARREHQQLEKKWRDDRAKARDLYQIARDPKWWNRAEPSDIAHTYVTARAWADHDKTAANAQANLEEKILERWNIDAREMTEQALIEARERDLARGPELTSRTTTPTTTHTTTPTTTHTTTPTTTHSTARTASSAVGSDTVADATPVGEQQLTDTQAAITEPDPAHVDMATGEIKDHEPTGPGSDPADAEPYARARASDMPDAPDRAQEARLTAAKSFPISIRAALARVTGAARPDRAKTSPKTQERDRSLEQGL